MESIYKFVMAELDSTRLTYEEIAQGADLSRRTVEKIARQEIKDPGVSQVEALARFFRGTKPKQKAIA